MTVGVYNNYTSTVFFGRIEIVKMIKNKLNNKK